MGAPTQMGPAGICHPVIFRWPLFLRGQGYRALLGAGTRGASSQPRALRRRPPVGMSKDYARVLEYAKGSVDPVTIQTETLPSFTTPGVSS